MDPTIVSALSAILGSLVGGSASIVTAWVTQRAQGRRETIGAEIRKRELLYAEFINECSKLAIDSLDRTFDDTANLLQAYALLNRIRLVCSDEVIIAADSAIRRICERYSRPNISKEDILALAISNTGGPLLEFSEACRTELKGLLHST